MPESCRIALLADLHFDPSAALSPRPDRFTKPRALQILQRAVRRLNRFEKPDVTIVLGDLLASGRQKDAELHYMLLRQALDQLEMPWLAIPGNRDLGTAEFYRYFPDPRPWLEVKNARFVPFPDTGFSGGLGRHDQNALETLKAARRNWDGSLAALRHTPLLPLGQPGSRSLDARTDQALTLLQENRYSLVAAGHFHVSVNLIMFEGIGFCVCPMLTAAPFGYQIIELTPDKVPELTLKQLAMPAKLRLTDAHCHTEFAYCGRDMNAAEALKVAADMGLAGLVFAEHSGQLYFSRKDYWEHRWFPEGLAAADPREQRFNAYIQALDNSGCPPWSRGLEIDCDRHGRPVVKAGDLRHFHFRAGGLHHLPSLRTPQIDPATVIDEFMGLLERFIPSGVQVLTHPLRFLHNNGIELPEAQTEALIRMLREHKVAAEINFHHKPTTADFVRRCLRAGVRLSLGSDAHSLPEVGELAPHLQLLEECGCLSNLEDVLLQIPAAD